MAYRLKLVVLVALVALVALVPAGPAFARARKAPPDRVFAGPNNQGLASFVKLENAKGTKVTAVFSYAADCADGSAFLWSGARGLTVKNKKFKFDRAEDADGPEIHLAGTIGKTAVKGTWQVKFANVDQNGVQQGTCDSGVVGFKLPRSGYGGQVAGGYPIALAFNKAHTKLTLVQTVTPVKCQSGSTFTAGRVYGNFPVISSGAFGDEFDDSAEEVQADPHPTFHVKFRGRLGKTKATGSWQLSAQMKDKAGNVVDNCDSGPLSWSATA